ncbi:extracellular catalytic domain type 2 short-chain-length polyhydroxyalkanoate depolymerase [Arenimonas composti]|uniref:Poly (3-hydroxybutyrate) depolymerase n=1 Tax=Arenimonas composti TR7-09 = DSM 18010 TaxID=1121013 RepID=A0A091BAV6_9GAMM|nr:PHB depolymerase family esterase [Arenimonas composti]KFN49803.1 hypothetical protein P873_09615 [Arenimonas composti TR7-09 = DSM 18010]
MSQRAAAAARLFFPLLLLAGCGREPAPALPALVIDPDRVAVAGLSSGAYMATQVHLAFSDRLRGAALVAGGPYGCAVGTLQIALGSCMQGAPAPDLAALAQRVRERADRGALAPLDGLRGDHVFVLHGRDDTTVAPALGAAAADLYAELGGDGLALQRDFERGFAHVWPTVDRGGDCGEPAAPWLGACGFDAAGAALAWLYGPPSRDAAAGTGGELREFDQTVFAADGSGSPQLADRGFAYVPKACAAGEACGLLVVFHGCEQSAVQVGNVFARDAGFNRWADVYGLVVLYPQVQPSWLPLNPKACWDWWGYTGADYDTRAGAQVGWVGRVIDTLAAAGGGAR